jgi:hypothetical protein
MPYDYAECKKRYQEEFSLMSLTPEGMRYLKVRSLIDSEPLTTSSSLRQWLGLQKQRFNRHRIEQLRVQVFNDNKISAADLDVQLRAAYHRRS